MALPLKHTGTIYVCVHILLCVFIYIHANIYTYIHIHIYIYIYIYMYIHGYAYMYKGMCACMHSYMYIYVFARKRLFTYNIITEIYWLLLCYTYRHIPADAFCGDMGQVLLCYCPASRSPYPAALPYRRRACSHPRGLAANSEPPAIAVNLLQELLRDDVFPTDRSWTPPREVDAPMYQGALVAWVQNAWHAGLESWRKSLHPKVWGEENSTILSLL